MFEIAKLNPVLTSANAVADYDFLTDNGITYLICNTTLGDDAYRDDVTFAAGEYLNGFDLKAWEGQKLVIDEKHIAYGAGQDYDDITAGTTLLTINNAGKLVIAAGAPATGIYFKVTDKTTLTGKAVKAMVMVA